MTNGVNPRILSAYAKHPLFASLKDWISRCDVTAALEKVERPSGDNAALWLAPRKGFEHALLFLHGMGNDHLYAHFDLFETLLRHGIAILSVDLDGHGVLSHSALDAGALGSLAPESWKLLRRLAPDAKLHLAGYSLGAALSLESAASLQPLTLTLIAFPLCQPKIAQFLPRETFTLAHPIFVTAVLRHGSNAVWPALGRWGRERYPVRLVSATDGWAYMKEVGRYLGQLDPENLAAGLSMPTLWIGGRHDGLCPVTHLKKLKGQTPHGKLVTLSGAGHLTTLFHKELGPRLAGHVTQVASPAFSS